MMVRSRFNFTVESVADVLNQRIASFECRFARDRSCHGKVNLLLARCTIFKGGIKNYRSSTLCGSMLYPATLRIGPLPSKSEAS
jgi:hypothetical protein